MDTNLDNQFKTALGNMVVRWNIAEGALRQLLAGLCGGNSIEDNLRARIVTSELGSVSLAYALLSFATNLVPEDVGKRISHAVEYFERLRDYRNYYVHGIISIADVGGKAAGVIQHTTAKGKLVEFNEMIEMDDLQFVTAHSDKLHDFTVAITRHMFWSGKVFGSGRTPLPDMLPLPDKIPKNRLPLQERFLRPRSFPV